MKTVHRCVAIGGVVLLCSVCRAQVSPSQSLRWSKAAPNTSFEIRQGISIEGFRTKDLSLFVNLDEVHETRYNRVWVQIFNRGKSPILFNPETVSLVWGNKIITPETPDNAAKSVELVGEATSDRVKSPQCTITSPVGCQVTNTQIQMGRQIRTFAFQQSQWIRDNGLKRLNLPPGSNVQGAVLFRKDKKSVNYILRIPVGDTTFEFPLHAQNKLPAYID